MYVRSLKPCSHFFHDYTPVVIVGCGFHGNQTYNLLGKGMYGVYSGNVCVIMGGMLLGLAALLARARTNVCTFICFLLWLKSLLHDVIEAHAMVHVELERC